MTIQNVASVLISIRSNYLKERKYSTSKLQNQFIPMITFSVVRKWKVNVRLNRLKPKHLNSVYPWAFLLVILRKRKSRYRWRRSLLQLVRLRVFLQGFLRFNMCCNLVWNIKLRVLHKRQCQKLKFQSLSWHQINPWWALKN